MKRVFPVLVIFSLAACAQPRGSISTFEECVLAGYPVMESYPRRCAVPGGPSFTELLPPVAPELGVFTGALLDVSGNVDGHTSFRFVGRNGVEHAVLEPEAELAHDLAAVATGSPLSIRGWRGPDGVVHAVGVEIPSER